MACLIVEDICADSRRRRRRSERILEQHQQAQQRSALDLAADLRGRVESGIPDLASNKHYLRAFRQ